MSATLSNLLIVDTSMNACTVVVHSEDETITTRTDMMERGQAERLMPMILETLERAGLKSSDIDEYACVTGPGTFTGLRVGLATIRALAQVSNKPTIPVSTFDALAASVQTVAPLAILIETKRTDFYLRAPGRDDSCVNIEELKSIIQPDWILLGDAVTRAVRDAELPNKSIILNCASAEGLVAVARKGTQAVLEPVYLRGADVSVSRQKTATII